ncbi:MAG TPA: hypothetical protein VN039_07985 [Nitrospira sp.]|nr:hypothetical protein [Nitrospira sp.]
MMNKNMPQSDAALLKQMDAYWRATNYLSVGQVYLLDNPLLKQPLKLEHLSDDDLFGSSPQKWIPRLSDHETEVICGG